MKLAHTFERCVCACFPSIFFTRVDTIFCIVNENVLLINQISPEKTSCSSDTPTSSGESSSPTIHWEQQQQEDDDDEDEEPSNTSTMTTQGLALQQLLRDQLIHPQVNTRPTYRVLFIYLLK